MPDALIPLPEPRPLPPAIFIYDPYEPRPPDKPMPPPMPLPPPIPPWPYFGTLKAFRPPMPGAACLL